MNLKTRFIRYCVLLIASIFVSSTYASHYLLPDKPLILIGASYANGNTPLQQDLQGPLFGISVGAGDYVDLGMALTRFGAKVRNEGQAGATTFSRSEARQLPTLEQSCRTRRGAARHRTHRG